MKGSKSNISDHQLSVSSLGLLFRLFRENRVDRRYRSRVFRIFVWAVFTQPLQWLQQLLIRRKLRRIDLHRHPPTFVIGHWRSGTTFLHYILSRDEHFGYLNNYQALLVRISFVGKGFMDRLLNRFMPKTRPQDNIRMTAYEPAEEEQPLTNVTFCSGLNSWFFPRNLSYFKKYNLFQGITPREKRKWARRYSHLLKMISLANQGKPLLLKNPHNTGRIKELLELFPNAKFIFIHRHPFDVFLSTRHLFEKTITTQFLQEISREEIDENIIYFYRSTMKKYLAERDLIPRGQLVEISFADLENDPMTTVEQIYEQLSLPDLDAARPAMENYLDSVRDYKKNQFRDPEASAAEQLLDKWGFAFREWGYREHRDSFAG